MGCGGTKEDPVLREISEQIKNSVVHKSSLQFQINRLNYLDDKKKNCPDITEVKNSQLQSIKLAKDIKDTENLLNSIKGPNESPAYLVQEIYNKLRAMLEEKENEQKANEEYISSCASVVEAKRKQLSELGKEISSLQQKISESSSKK